MAYQDKIQKTNILSSSDLDRVNGTVKVIRNAWENLPEDVDVMEREMFIEITSRILSHQSKSGDKQKDQENLN